jgi:hypothetical protein
VTCGGGRGLSNHYKIHFPSLSGETLALAPPFFRENPGAGVQNPGADEHKTLALAPPEPFKEPCKNPNNNNNTGSGGLDNAQASAVATAIAQEAAAIAGLPGPWEDRPALWRNAPMLVHAMLSRGVTGGDILSGVSTAMARRRDQGPPDGFKYFTREIDRAHAESIGRETDMSMRIANADGKRRTTTREQTEQRISRALGGWNPAQARGG